MNLCNLLLKLAVVFSLLSIVVSCTIETLQIASASNSEIVLSIPATENVEVRSTPTSSECYIYNAAVLVMSSNTISQAEYITSIADNGTQSPRLRFVNISPSSGETIHVICNFDTSVTAETIADLASGSKTLSDAQAVITGKAAYTSGDSNTTGELDTPLLMYGSGTYGGTLNMTFQVAKISVEVEENSKAATLDLDIVNFFSVASAPNTTWGASSSSNRQNSDGKHKISTDDADGWIYLYESDRDNDYPYTSLNSIVLLVNNPDSQVEDRVRVAGGTGYICLTYDTMNNGAVSQYNTFERGKHYNFKITNIYTRGYDTIEEALNNPGNVEYEVEVTDDWSTDYQYNGQYTIATAVDTAYMQYPVTTPTDLLQIGTYLVSDSSISTRTVSLVRVKSNGSEYEIVSTDYAQLYDNDGYAVNDNLLTLPAGTNSDYTLKYTTGDEIVEGMYLRIAYGNMEKFITLPSVSFSYSVSDIPISGGTVDVSVSKTVWFPGKDKQTEDYTDYTVSLVDESGDETNYDWLEVNNDGSLNMDAQPGMEFGDIVTNVNLAESNGFNNSINTANCYIVNAPGTYYFPLVYGNGIKNGDPNSAAYTNQASGTTGSNNFVDHTGATITQPYIYQKYNPANAIIVWQDSEDMITDVAIDSQGENLTFTVANPIKSEGNAVLAVTDAYENIMWSWHIWVTVYNPYNTSETTKVTNYNNVTYYAMNNYLGSCSTIDSPERSAIVQISPNDIDVPGLIIEITQEATSQVGDNCYYQSGRKDPFPGIQGGMDGMNKPTYGSYAWETGTTMAKYYSNMTTYQEQILYPYSINVNSNYPEIVRGFNYWNAALTQQKTSHSVWNDVTVKTVYDPCPSGFCMPPNGLFAAFFTTNPTTTGNHLLNVDTEVTKDDEMMEINLPNGGTYNLMIVPYRYGINNTDGRGSIYTTIRYSIFTSTPLYYSNNGAYYHYASFIGGFLDSQTDMRYANMIGGTNTYNARAVIPVRESSSTDDWTY